MELPNYNPTYNLLTKSPGPPSNPSAQPGLTEECRGQVGMDTAAHGSGQRLARDARYWFRV